MTTFSYSLSTSTMENLKKMVDLGLINIVDKPRRNESSEVQRFIEDYIRELNSRK